MSRKKDDDSAEVVSFPYTHGNKISLEAATWICDHVRSADYHFGAEALIVLYEGDGYAPPTEKEPVKPLILPEKY